MKKLWRFAIISSLMALCLSGVPELGFAVDTAHGTADLTAAVTHAKAKSKARPFAQIGEKVPVEVTELNSGKKVCLTANNRPAAVLCWMTLNRTDSLKKDAQYLDKMYKKYHNKMNFYTLVETGTNKAMVHRYMDASDIKIPTVYGHGIQYVYFFPCITLIDSQGYLRTRFMKNTSDVERTRLIEETIARPLPEDVALREKEMQKQDSEDYNQNMELIELPPMEGTAYTMLATVKKSGVMSSSGSFGNNPELLQIVRSGYLELSNGNLAEAVNYYSKAIDKDATNGILYLLRGKVYEMMGNYELAKKDTQQVRMLQPNDSFMLLEASRIDSQHRPLLDLAKELEDVYKKRPSSNNRTWVFLMSQFYIRGGQADKGLACYKEFMQKDENPTRGYADYGLLLLQAGRYAEADTCFDKSLQLLRLGIIDFHTYFAGSLYKEKAWSAWKQKKNSEALLNMQKAFYMYKGKSNTDWYALKAAIERNMGLLQDAAQDEAIAYDNKAVIKDPHSYGIRKVKNIKIPGIPYSYIIPINFVISPYEEAMAKGYVFLAGNSDIGFMSGVKVQSAADYSYLPYTFDGLKNSQKKAIAEGIKRDLLAQNQTAKNIVTDFIITDGKDYLVLNFDDGTSHKQSYIFVHDGQFISFDYEYPIAIADLVEPDISCPFYYIQYLQ